MTSLRLEPLRLPDERETLIAFLTSNDFPFHSGGTPSSQAVEEMIAAGAFTREGRRTFWLRDDRLGLVGYLRLEDLDEDTPMLDLRLADAHRGKGFGTAALHAAAEHVFTHHGVERFVGCTRADNVAMRRVFEKAGWVQEAHYRRAWPVTGSEPVDAVGYALLRRDWDTGSFTTVPVPLATTAVHHIELWTHDLTGTEASFGWLMEFLGWHFVDQDWSQGLCWRHPSGPYLVLEQSPDVVGSGHERLRPGLNHLALTIDSRASLDALRREARTHGWRELFAERYPTAGGPDHIALFLENEQGFEMEIVARTS